MAASHGLKLNLRITKWAILGLLLALILTMAYILEPFSHNPMRLVHAVKSFSRSVPYPFLVFTVFIALGSLALIPINILLLSAALLFPGWKGFFCGFFGALLTTFIEYMIGRHLISAEYLEKKGGARVRAVRKRISENGLAAMTFLSLVPVAPQIINNLVAGVCRIRLLHVLIGTAIGITPGLLVLNIFGRSVRKFIAHPNWFTASLVVGVLIAMVWLARLIRAHFSRKQTHGVSTVH